MPTPEVITGARTPRPERTAEVARRVAERGPGPQPSIPVGKRVYKSRYSALCVQVTAPEHITLQDGRKIRGAKPVKVQFKDGLATLDIVKDADTILWLDQHPYMGRDFTDFAVEVKQTRDKEAKSALSSLTNPEILKTLSEADRERVVELLLATKDEDFEVPLAPKDKDKQVEKT